VIPHGEILALRGEWIDPNSKDGGNPPTPLAGYGCGVFVGWVWPPAHVLVELRPSLTSILGGLDGSGRCRWARAGDTPC